MQRADVGAVAAAPVPAQLLPSPPGLHLLEQALLQQPAQRQGCRALMPLETPTGRSAPGWRQILSLTLHPNLRLP